MLQLRTENKTKIFATIWFGQILSIFGSSLTSFAIGVWVYQHTKSVTQFALTILAVAVPSLLVTPLAGALVDRWDRRKVMIIGDIGSGICSLIIALLLYIDRLEVWQICLIIAAKSIFNVFHVLAFTAIVTVLIPKQHFGRVSGMMQMGPATARIIAPFLAGMFLAVIQIEGILLIDIVTFVIALVCLFIVRVPRPDAAAQGNQKKESLLREVAYGWLYITARPGLLRLLAFFTITNLSMGFAAVLFTPLVLSFSTIQMAGIIGSINSGGLLAGSIIMSVWGGPKRRVYGVLGFGVVLGLCLTITGLLPSVPFVAAASFGVLFTAPIINGCSQAIWQSKTPPHLQGRVFAVRQVIAWSSLPLAYLIAGPLADKVLEPLLATDGLLAGTVGEIIGVGPGRGMGLLFIIAGLFATLTAIGAFWSPRLRLLEDELPDAVSEHAISEETPVEVFADQTPVRA